MVGCLSIHREGPWLKGSWMTATSLPLWTGLERDPASRSYPNEHGWFQPWKKGGTTSDSSFTNGPFFYQWPIIWKILAKTKLKGEGSTMIHITFPDGSVKTYEKGITLAGNRSIHFCPVCAKIAFGKVNGTLYDLNRPIEEDAEIVPHLQKQDPEAFCVLNHSAAHLLAQAVKRLFLMPDLALARQSMRILLWYRCPDFGKHLDRIEAEMRKIVNEALDIERRVVAVKRPFRCLATIRISSNWSTFRKNRKLPFIPKANLRIWKGIHIGNTKHIQHFKLLSVAGLTGGEIG